MNVKNLYFVIMLQRHLKKIDYAENAQQSLILTHKYRTQTVQNIQSKKQLESTLLDLKVVSFSSRMISSFSSALPDFRLSCYPLKLITSDRIGRTRYRRGNRENHSQEFLEF